MSSLRLLTLVLAAIFVSVPGARADLTALSRVDQAASRIGDAGGGAEVVLSLSQPVPWRVRLLDDPRRLVVDLAEVIWPEDLTPDGTAIARVRTGRAGPGWSRLVADLSLPFAVTEAGMVTGEGSGGAVLTLRLGPVSPEAFADLALQQGAAPDAATGRAGDGTIRVMLDPGHGGIDPGAEAAGLTEAALMLTFARELREVLLRTGGFAVAMTRDGDVFVPLERRITLAREAGADLFLSLHADALPEDAGHASGATVYTLSGEASDRASQLLAERHDQSDLLTGVDLRGQEDEIALVLMDLARQDTMPRTGRLADSLVERLARKVGPLNNTPRREAAFSVLKSPDIPSVLIELGFLSSQEDRKKISDPEWRLRAARGIRDGLAAWAEAEAVLQALSQ